MVGRARNSSIYVPQGPPGPPGPPGEPGADGQMLFSFEIVNGNLILTYEDGTAEPNFVINAQGHLIYTF
jgi:hypothetical protein